MYDTLTPELKKSYDESSELSKEQFLSIVTGFDQQGLNSNGVVDVAKSKQLWSSFFGQMAHDTRAFLADGKTNNPNFGKLAYMSTLRRYKNIQEFIIAANGHLKSNEIDGFAAFYDLLQSTNSKLGMSGAEQVFNENGILIIEVKSFAANIMLNGHTKHCIKDVISQWDSYVGNHNNKQYYIYNFNVPLRDNYSTIGITVEPKKSIRAIHNTPDHSVTTNDFKKLLKKWEKDYNIDKDLWEYFLPMNEEEMNSKEKSKLANREIVKKGISIEEIIKYVTEDGADINKDSSKALENAVEEDDIVKSKLILDLGGLTNIKKGSEAIISKAKNIDMIKLLVERGSEMTGDVFSNVVDKLDSLQYCLKAGLDPAFNSNLPLRACFKGSYVSPSNMGSSYFDSFNVLIEYIKKTNQLDSIKQKGNMIVKWAAEFGRVEILKEFKKIGIFDNFNEADWKSVISWVGISRKASEESKAETKKYLESIR
jgi:DNA-binding ferritin-like protein